MPERQAALARLVKSGYAVEDGCLPGAIRPNQRGDFAVLARTNDRSSTATSPPKRIVK